MLELEVRCFILRALIMQNCRRSMERIRRRNGIKGTAQRYYWYCSRLPVQETAIVSKRDQGSFQANGKERWNNETKDLGDSNFVNEKESLGEIIIHVVVEMSLNRPKESLEVVES